MKHAFLCCCLAVCRPLEVVVGFEFSEYRVQENIRNTGFALQICASSLHSDFSVQVTIGITNDTAEGTFLHQRHVNHLSTTSYNYVATHTYIIMQYSYIDLTISNTTVNTLR